MFAVSSPEFPETRCPRGETGHAGGDTALRARLYVRFPTGRFVFPSHFTHNHLLPPKGRVMIPTCVLTVYAAYEPFSLPNQLRTVFTRRIAVTAVTGLWIPNRHAVAPVPLENGVNTRADGRSAYVLRLPPSPWSQSAERLASGTASCSNVAVGLYGEKLYCGRPLGAGVRDFYAMATG